MERSYTYFKNLLSECLDSINQLKLKSQLVNDFKQALLAKTENLQEQLDNLKSNFFLTSEETIIDKLNQIKQLQISLDEQEEINKRLQLQITSLNYEISSHKKGNNDPIDDLPF